MLSGNASFDTVDWEQKERLPCKTTASTGSANVLSSHAAASLMQLY